MFQTIKNINRVREITRILLKYGFEEVVANTPLKAVIPKRTRLGWASGNYQQYSRWELMRMAAEELGATFIKLAQILANRPDLVPEELLIEFEKLQSDVPPFAIETVREIIESETKQKIEDLFDVFEEKPLGAASIGQVHKARLKDGTDVVVKVRRPQVKERVETDLIILKEIVRRGESFFQSQGLYNVMDIVKAFEKSILKELDYNTEARYITQFRNYYKDYTNFYVPKAFREYSTDKILFLELIKGCKITDVETLKRWGLEPTEIAEKGMDIYMVQIFEHGYFHADPHPGNILIRPDGVLCLIDFGMIGKLSQADKFSFAGILIGMAQKDAKKMARNFRRIAMDADIPDMRSFENDLQDIIDDFASLNVDEMSMADLAASLQDVIRDYRLEVPGGVFIILRALTILEGIGKTIHPTFDTYSFFRPYAIRLFKAKYSPKNITEELMDSGGAFLAFINSFPVEVNGILRKIRKGKLHIEVEHSGYESGVEKLNRAINRLTISFIIVGLLVASGLVMNAGQFAGWATEGGVPYLSILGFVMAFLLTMMLFFSNWWSSGK